MISSFADSETEKLFFSGKSRVYRSILNVARRKLQVLDNTRRLEYLRQPPANTLEALQGDRAEQHSIRVNAQYRICFVWIGEDAHEVEIVDDH